MYASRTRKKGTRNGHKESGEQDQADGHRVHRLPRGVHHHPRVVHLYGPDEGRGRALEVYVLDGNVPILVRQTTMEETLDVEAKSHVEMFHHYFFTLAPDDKYIRYTMEKAMYLVDETGLAQYNTLKEKGFYSNIMGTSAVFSIFCDSIRFDREKMEFTYYGRQRIERRSNILMRELVTAGQLKRVPRTENNPHGLLIVNWRTLLNRDIEQKTKNSY